eukprot:6411245-Alexandrium_andersonii.AAC.1
MDKSDSTISPNPNAVHDHSSLRLRLLPRSPSACECVPLPLWTRWGCGVAAMRSSVLALGTAPTAAPIP